MTYWYWTLKRPSHEKLELKMCWRLDFLLAKPFIIDSLCFVQKMPAYSYEHFNAFSDCFPFLPSPRIFFYPWLNSIFQSFRRVSFCFEWLCHVCPSLVIQIVDCSGATSNITHRKQSQTLYSSPVHWVFFVVEWGYLSIPVDYYYIDRKK